MNGPPRIALTREVPESIAGCELTHLVRTPIDVARARAQHAAYEATLEELGCRIERLPPLPDHPDSVFVEDTAIVVDELAVVTRPGAASRRGETASVAAALAQYRELAAIAEPATLDGGDVLVVGKCVWVGLTGRSDARGVAQLGRLLAPYGYTVTGVDVRGCLHLKSAATAVDDRTVLVNPGWVDPGVFAPLDVLAVDPTEPGAANVLRIGETVLFPAAFRRTAERLEALGLRLRRLEVDELAKAEGALTCCSILVA